MVRDHESYFVVVALLLSLSGCALLRNVDRPDTNLCVANVELLQRKCVNLKTDYDSDGNLNKNATPIVYSYKSAQEMLQALDKSVGTDPVGWGNLKAYLRNLRSAGE